MESFNNLSASLAAYIVSGENELSFKARSKIVA